MKIIDSGELREWVACGQDGWLTVTEEGRLKFGDEIPHRFFMFPKDYVRRSFDFARWIIGWLPPSDERLLWIEFTPRWGEGHHVLEAWRRGLGERRALLEAPGQLFVASPWDRDDWGSRLQLDEEEDVSLSSLIVLLMCYDAEAYLIVRDCPGGVYIGDEHFIFWAPEEARLDAVVEASGDFSIQPLKGHPWSR